jgi:hypothetical protein
MSLVGSNGGQTLVIALGNVVKCTGQAVEDGSLSGAIGGSF